MNDQIKRRVWLVCFMFTILFWIALLFSLYGCTIPLYKTEINNKTPVADWHEFGVMGYWNDLKRPEYAITLPKCQGIAAQESL